MDRRNHVSGQTGVTGSNPILTIFLKVNNMDLKKELLEFLEANNNFGLEEPEKIVDIYIDVYKEGKSENIILNNKNNEYTKNDPKFFTTKES
jgi:hypothetical protein